MSASLPPDFSLAVAELPRGLQEIVARELKLGNIVVEVGHSFPAAPIGVYIKLLLPLAVPDGPLPAGVTFAQLRPNSLWTREYADEKRYSSAPAPRTKPIAPDSIPFSDDYSCELDFRGETLTYEEPQRITDMQCFWTRRYMIEAKTITEWSYRGSKIVPVTDEERIAIVRRVVLYAKQAQGVVMTVNR